MICQRCVIVVENELRNFGIQFNKVEIGIVQLDYPITAEQRMQLNASLKKFGLEISTDRKVHLIDQLKTLIVELVYQQDALLSIRLSDYLEARLHYDYTYLANLFSDIENQTIERYFITKKIERVKGLLLNEEYTLSEIAYQLHYSSVAHLSNQFKKLTGITPSQFKSFSDQQLDSSTAA